MSKTAKIVYGFDCEDAEIDLDEYTVQFFEGGVHLEEADYFTDDADDAVGTAIAEGAISIVSSNAAVKQAMATVALKLAYK